MPDGVFGKDRSRANRLVACVESDELVHWDSSQVVLDTGGRDAPAVSTVDRGDRYPRGRDCQFYGMMVAPHQDSYIGMANYLNEVTGEMDVRLMHSFEGIQWQREPVQQVFMGPAAGAWDSGHLGFVQGGSPARVEDDLYFY